VIDHAASLQRQVNRLARAVQVLALAPLLMSVALMIAGQKLWRD
jgi:hypothetical protein